MDAMAQYTKSDGGPSHWHHDHCSASLASYRLYVAATGHQYAVLFAA